MSRRIKIYEIGVLFSILFFAVGTYCLRAQDAKNGTPISSVAGAGDTEEKPKNANAAGEDEERLRVFRGVDMTDEQLAARVSELVKYDVINLNRNIKITDEGMKALSECVDLRKLNLSNTGVTERGLATLLGLKKLNELSVNFNKINDESLSTVSEFKNLRGLGLAFTRISDAGLVKLAEMPQLEDLYLDGTKITDEGLKNLAQIPRIRSLSVTHTGITGSGLKELEVLKNLESLDLSYCDLKDISSLANLRNLKELRLSKNSLQDQQVSALSKELANCEITVDTDKLN